MSHTIKGYEAPFMSIYLDYWVEIRTHHPNLGVFIFHFGVAIKITYGKSIL